MKAYTSPYAKPTRAELLEQGIAEMHDFSKGDDSFFADKPRSWAYVFDKVKALPGVNRHVIHIEKGRFSADSLRQFLHLKGFNPRVEYVETVDDKDAVLLLFPYDKNKETSEKFEEFSDLVMPVRSTFSDDLKAAAHGKGFEPPEQGANTAKFNGQVAQPE